LERKEQEFQQYYFDYFGEDGRIVKLNADLTRPIIEKMNTILNRIGADEKFSVIFDVAPGGIVFAAEGLDLTGRVLDELNATVKAPPTGNATGEPAKPAEDEEPKPSP
jgi:Skp family chaperone for outer membrane proteins